MKKEAADLHIRIPPDLSEMLKLVAHKHDHSMNRQIIQAIREHVDREMTPERWQRFAADWLDKPEEMARKTREQFVQKESK